ncbi:MAG: lamin tail domain-containing protein, partial [Bacteroidota bacterium]
MRCLVAIASSMLSSISALAQTAQHLVVSEVQTAGTSTQDEFVELYNPTAAPVNLAGWRLARKTSSGTESNLLTSFPAVSIPARGFLLIASAEYDTIAHEMILPDVLYSTSQRLAADNTVILYSDAAVSIVDKVAMGAATDREGIAAPNPVTNGSMERKARSSSTPAALGDGGIDAFAGNGFDTDNNANDFVAQNDSHPQNSLSEVEGLLVRNTTTDAFFGSIQLGIDRAGAGHTLEVAEGIFSEELNVDKNLTLKGVQAGVDARSRAGGESVVQKITIDSAAIDVTIDGFKLDIGTRTTFIRSDAAGSTTITNIIVNGGYASGDFSNPIILINRGATAVFSQNRVTDASGSDSMQSAIGFGPLTTTLTLQENDVVGGALAITDL